MLFPGPVRERKSDHAFRARFSCHESAAHASYALAARLVEVACLFLDCCRCQTNGGGNLSITEKKRDATEESDVFELPRKAREAVFKRCDTNRSVRKT